MSDLEIGIIDRLIESEKPKRVLEWGSGGSTVYFPKKHECIERWLSIEHNGNYIKNLLPNINSKVDIIWVPEDNWYEDSVKFHTDRYDMILIDGLRRNSCIPLANSLLAKDGFILLHDAGRLEYIKEVRQYGKRRKVLCEGAIKTDDGGFAHRGLVKLWK